MNANSTKLCARELYEAMVAAGVEISHYKSDMFFPNNEKTRELVSKYEFQENVTTFVNLNKRFREIWYCIHFAYNPSWGKKARK